MRYVIDHDLHIHSYLSLCSQNAEQTADAILKYGIKNNFKYLCLTDHVWGNVKPNKNDFYNGNYENTPQDIPHISKILPLPQSEKTGFFFGCETDMDDELNIGLAADEYEKFDFVIIPTTHLHMYPFVSVEKSAETYVNRFDKILSSDLPFRKIGIAHLTTKLIAPKDNWKTVLNIIPESIYKRLFRKSAELGLGIEINSGDLAYYNPEETDVSLRVFDIAKECGCKFYFGSDAHTPKGFLNSIQTFEKMVDLLDLKEEDKFNPFITEGV